MIPGHIEATGDHVYVNRIDGSEMVLVTAGAHRFLIDRCAVSNGRMRRFMEATGADPEELFPADAAMSYAFDTHYFLEPKMTDHPAGSATQAIALRYCRWNGTALPSIEQWMLAAYGSDGRRYPWGNEWDSDACQHADRVLRKPVPAAERRAPLTPGEYPLIGPPTVRVDSFPQAASPYGLLCCLGNVEEWCADTRPHSFDPSIPQASSIGGSYLWFPEQLVRDKLVVFQYPQTAVPSIGLRCALTLPPV
jgi:formylglycine-generating enzyme required for sulfatase activity